MQFLKRLGIAATLGLCVVISLLASVAEASSAQRPNILLILSDDMGYSDLGCFGGEIQTPNLDGLAKRGLRFTQFYNTARCCPTRASLITGQYPHMAGMGHMNRFKALDGYRGDLSKNAVTIAEVLHDAGYRTYMIGKWHIAENIDPKGSKHNWPLQRGFDKFYGTLAGYGSFYDPATLCRGNRYITVENDPEYRPKSFYYTDALTDNAIGFLQEHAKAGKEPFFMYLAYTAAHWPIQAKPEDIAKYRGKYAAGYDSIRQDRLKRLKELGLLDARWKPALTVSNWSETGNKEWEMRCMETYAAMIDCMDQGIGRIVSALKAQGQFENTLIFFLQDNGACAEVMGRSMPAPPSPLPKKNKKQPAVEQPEIKPLGPDDLQTRTIPIQTRDGRRVRQGPKAMPGPDDTYIAYGEAWANVCNTPFREYKHWVHEGGISTPLIAHWPQGIGHSQQGKFEPQMGHLIDIMATCVEVAGANYPFKRNAESIHPLPGSSLARAFAGKKIKRSEPIFWEHEGNRAIRDGKWKLVAKGPAGPWELYNMECDRTEMHNLAQEDPKRVEKMAAKWTRWAKQNKVLPWIWDPQQ